MSDRPLLVQTAEFSGTPIWPKFLVAGAQMYVVTFGILLARGLGISFSLTSAPLVALMITPAFEVGYASWYLISVKRITGTLKGAWSLPDAATVAVEADPARSLSHVLTLAQLSFPWLRSTLAEADGTLTLTRKTWLWGRSSVEVVATAANGGTQLRLRPRSPQLVPNLTGRAIIARLSAEIASDQQWRHP